MTRIFAFISMALVLAACNLGNTTPATIEVVEVVTATPQPVTATPSPTPTVFPETTSNSPATGNNVTTNNTSSGTGGDCDPPSNWVNYTVQAGDTLFSIARNANSSVGELTRINCLESSDLSTGQILAIPQAITNGAPDVSNQPITYWIGSDELINENSVQVGCATYLTPFETTMTQNSDPARNIQLALGAMLNANPSAPYRNLWGGRNLLVMDVTVDSNLQVSIRLETPDSERNFLLGGVCGDAELREQILLTILTNANAQVRTIRIMVDGMNLAQMLDQSGQSGIDAVFDTSSIALLPGYR